MCKKNVWRVWEHLGRQFLHGHAEWIKKKVWHEMFLIHTYTVVMVLLEDVCIGSHAIAMFAHKIFFRWQPLPEWALFRVPLCKHAVWKNNQGANFIKCCKCKTKWSFFTLLNLFHDNFMVAKFFKIEILTTPINFGHAHTTTPFKLRE